MFHAINSVFVRNEQHSRKEAKKENKIKDEKENKATGRCLSLAERSVWHPIGYLHGCLPVSAF